MIKVLKLIIGLLLIIIITSCTQKKNPVGFQNGPQPESITFGWDIFSNSISFEDSTKNYSSNSTLILGNYDDKKTKTLLRFINLPDSIASLESSVEIKFKIDDRYNIEDFSSLQFGLINKLWKENHATWFAATDSTSWDSETGFSENDYTLFEPDSIVCLEDSLTVYIEDNMLLDWIDSDSLNYGFVMFTEDDGFVKFLSAESDTISLKFDYLSNANDTEVNTYLNNATSDTFIYETDQIFEQYPDQMIASNIYPIRFYTKFDISDSIFIDSSSVINNQEDYNRMTINKAELILYYDEDNHYPLIQYSTLSPYLLEGDTLFYNTEDKPLISSEDYKYFYDGISSDSINADHFALDITNIVQNITSGEYENKGLIVKSIYENRDFFNVLFATENNVDEAKRPQLRIIYTPAYLDEE